MCQNKRNHHLSLSAKLKIWKLSLTYLPLKPLLVTCSVLSILPPIHLLYWSPFFQSPEKIKVQITCPLSYYWCGLLTSFPNTQPPLLQCIPLTNTKLFCLKYLTDHTTYLIQSLQWLPVRVHSLDPPYFISEELEIFKLYNI